MTRLDWGRAPRIYEDGVRQAVLYSDGIGVAWNGLIAVDEAASGTQSLENYFDGQRLVITQDIGDFEASLQAYTYPDEFVTTIPYSEEQVRKTFGLSYRTSSSDGDKIHVVYNAFIKKPENARSTVTNTIGPSVFRWDIRASAVNLPGAQPGAHLIIDTATAKPGLVTIVEDWLYGTAETDARLPAPEEFVDIFEAATTLRIRQNGDGTWTATGPDHIVQDNGDGSFTISAPTLHYLDSGIFVVDSF